MCFRLKVNYVFLRSPWLLLLLLLLLLEELHVSGAGGGLSSIGVNVRVDGSGEVNVFETNSGVLFKAL